MFNKKTSPNSQPDSTDFNSLGLEFPCIEIESVRTTEETYKFLTENNISIEEVLARHQSGDHGTRRADDKEFANIISAYNLAGKRIVVDSFGEGTSVVLSDERKDGVWENVWLQPLSRLRVNSHT